MNNQSISQKVEGLLDRMRIKDACLLLRRELQSFPNAGLLSGLDQAENTYRSLLRFFSTGAPDPSRDRQLADLRMRLLDIADRLDLAKNSNDSPYIFYGLVRNRKVEHASVESLLKLYSQFSEVANLAREAGNDQSQYRKSREDALNRIFNSVWSLPYDSNEELEFLADTVTSPDADFSLASQIVSATMLSILCAYDSSKVRFLLRVYEKAPDERIAARALTALILVAHSSLPRIRNDRSLSLEFESLADSIVNYARLRDLLINIIRTQDTERVSDKMRNEFLPGLAGLGPELVERFKNLSSEMDFQSIEENPEWMETLSKNGLLDKMREMTEMQSEGADVMMTPFSNLKNFSFFRDVSNWFLPFDPDHSCFASFSEETTPFLSTLSGIDEVMCDSDKFSFCLSLLHMPEAQRKAVSLGQNARFEELKEGLLADRELQARPVFKLETVRYLRDIYRFFKLFPRREEFMDPFALPFNFLDIPGVGSFFRENEILELVAEFYFKRGYYIQALPMFRLLADEKGGECWLWEKMGYCIEKSGGSDSESLDCYGKAQLLGSSGKWICQRMSAVCSRMGRHQQAALLLEDAMADGGEEQSLILDCASEYQLAGDVKKALSMFYKADYISAGNPDIWRYIADAEFNSGDLGKAGTYSRRVLESESRLPSDYRLAGHLAFLERNFDEAVKWYAKSIDSDDRNRKWKSEIIADMDRLESNGATREDLDLLMELMLYRID